MTIAGAWENEYGSRMSLAAVGRAVFGIYESTTGSTGQYRVVGWQSAADPTADAGQPVALAIAWRSVVDGARDASWNWTSSLGGQVSIIDGRELLILNHLLVATSSLAGVCDPGVYSDKLTYRRVADGIISGPCEVQQTDDFHDALTGSWSATGGAELEVVVKPEANGRFGVVSGTLYLASQQLEAVGFTDINAAVDHIDLQSVAIAAIDIAGNVAVTLGGWIDHATQTLCVQSLTSQATHSNSTYLQTAISPLSFNRHSAP